MQSLNSENNELNVKDKYNYLPDIYLHSPYHSRGMSENQRIFNNKIDELIKEKFENKPINHQAMKNKHLKKCKKQVYCLSFKILFLINYFFAHIQLYLFLNN